MTKLPKSYFLKYLVLGLSLFVAIVILSFISLGFIRHVAVKNKIEKHTRPGDLLKLSINRLTPKERLELVNELSIRENNTSPMKIFLVDSRGKVLSPFKHKGESLSPRKRPSKRPSFIPFHFGRRPPHPPPHNTPKRYKLDGTPEQYIVFDHNDEKGNQGRLFLLSLGILLFSLVLGIGCTILFMIISFRQQVGAMNKVIERLKGGDLKARIETGKFDELHHSKIKFNQMAEEIEGLVGSLRKAEASRKTLMSELAHDLRTPIASLRSITEIILNRRDVLPKEKVTKLLDTSIKEIDYFSLLVDDLLFLGLVNEPQYRKENKKISLNDIIKTEINDLATRYKAIEIDFNSIENIEINADPKLMTRLIRNALENSCSFAKSKVVIQTLKDEQNSLWLKFEDDGPGFSKEDLESYGQKKFSRELKGVDGARISVGLGSVIMKSIVESYHGELSVQNLTENSQIRGALVTIKLSQN